MLQSGTAVHGQLRQYVKLLQPLIICENNGKHAAAVVSDRKKYLSNWKLLGQNSSCRACICRMFWGIPIHREYEACPNRGTREIRSPLQMFTETDRGMATRRHKKWSEEQNRNMWNRKERNQKRGCPCYRRIVTGCHFCKEKGGLVWGMGVEAQLLYKTFALFSISL